MLRKTVILVITTLLAICAGCQSHTTSKEIARQQWSKTSAKIKLASAQEQYDAENYQKAMFDGGGGKRNIINKISN